MVIFKEGTQKDMGCLVVKQQREGLVKPWTTYIKKAHFVFVKGKNGRKNTEKVWTTKV